MNYVTVLYNTRTVNETSAIVFNNVFTVRVREKYGGGTFDALLGKYAIRFSGHAVTFSWYVARFFGDCNVIGRLRNVSEELMGMLCFIYPPTPNFLFTWEKY